MALTANKFIITNGAPASGKQIMQSAAIGPDDVTAIQEVAATSTQFGEVKVDGDLVLLATTPPTLYRIGQTTLSTDTLSSVTKQAVSLDIAGTATTEALLETNFPAASNEGRYGYVKGTTAQNGLYLVSSSVWVKQLDNSGDRSLLPNYAGGVAYTGANVMTASGTAKIRTDADDGDVSPEGGSAANLFDGNNGTWTTITNANLPCLVYKTMDASPAGCGEFKVRQFTSSVNSTQTLKAFEVFIRNSSGTITYLQPFGATSNEGTQGFTFSAGSNGNSLITLDNDMVASEELTIKTTNTTVVESYGIRVVTGGTSKSLFADIQLRETVDNTDLVDCVSMAVLQFAGYQKSETITATPASALDETNGYTEADATAGNITIDLPAPDSSLPGKIYRFKKTDSSANTVTIDADTTGGSTIDGSTTCVLRSQYDFVTVIDNGTSYDIMSHLTPSGSIGNLYVSSASASEAITATTYLNVLANATVADAGESTGDWTIDDTNKRMTYTGVDPINVHINAAISMTSSKSNEIARFRLAKNGTSVAATEIARKLGTGSDVGALAIGGVFSMATNDHIEIHATLDASTSDTITVTNTNLVASVI